jgi:hypothetical protein
MTIPIISPPKIPNRRNLWISVQGTVKSINNNEPPKTIKPIQFSKYTRSASCLPNVRFTDYFLYRLYNAPLFSIIFTGGPLPGKLFHRFVIPGLFSNYYDRLTFFLIHGHYPISGVWNWIFGELGDIVIGAFFGKIIAIPLALMKGYQVNRKRVRRLMRNYTHYNFLNLCLDNGGHFSKYSTGMLI